MDRKLDDVVQALRFGKEQNRKCSLLIGAGCSVSAGIPSAGGFVDLIRDKFPEAYARAVDKTYPRCMAELAPGFQRDLIATEVDRSTLNWGHVAIVGDDLVGTVTKKGAARRTLNRDVILQGYTDRNEIITSDYVFCLDRKTGKSRWPDGRFAQAKGAIG